MGVPGIHDAVVHIGAQFLLHGQYLHQGDNRANIKEACNCREGRDGAKRERPQAETGYNMVKEGIHNELMMNCINFEYVDTYFKENLKRRTTREL